MNSRNEVRRQYIVGALIEAAAMYPEDARSYLAEHDAAHRTQVLRETADAASATIRRYHFTGLREDQPEPEPISAP
ncbi:hypothetical protein [Streptomyces hebeiensis]